MMMLRQKGGRPVTIGGDRYIGLRLPSDLLVKLDALANAAGVGRSELIRRVLERAVEATRKKTTPVRR